MHFGAVSRKGKVRKLNEDSYYINTTEPVYFVVADGMGGHSAGEVASSAAIETIKAYVEDNQIPIQNEEDARAIICGAMRAANSTIFSKASNNEEMQGMGTTVDMCVYHKGMIYIGHVGDSRVYKITPDAITRLTTDHSLVELLIQSGDITKEQAQHHPQKNLITRAIGVDSFVDIDFYASPLAEGEAILMCSDGLTNMVPEDEIKTTVNNGTDPDEIVHSLADKANENGGTDNITIIIILQ